MEEHLPVLLKIRVHPSSKVNLVQRKGPDSFDIFVRVSPIRELANQECLRILADHLGCFPSELRILRGRHSSHKIIEWRSKC